MRFHEVPKRAQFSIGMELGAGLVIGVKGYVLLILIPAYGTQKLNFFWFFWQIRVGD
jgi:hypothetical protein